MKVLLKRQRRRNTYSGARWASEPSARRALCASSPLRVELVETMDLDRLDPLSLKSSAQRVELVETMDLDRLDPLSL